jgi:hypothetical protein
MNDSHNVFGFVDLLNQLGSRINWLDNTFLGMVIVTAKR